MLYQDCLAYQLDFRYHLFKKIPKLKVLKPYNMAQNFEAIIIVIIIIIISRFMEKMSYLMDTFSFHMTLLSP